MKLRLPTPDEVFGLLCTGLVLCILVLAGIGVSLAYNAARSDHRVDYCYISASRRDSASPTIYYVNEHRLYTSDVYLGPFDTVEQALEVAAKIKCPEVSVEP